MNLGVPDSVCVNKTEMVPSVARWPEQIQRSQATADALTRSGPLSATAHVPDGYRRNQREH